MKIGNQGRRRAAAFATLILIAFCSVLAGAQAKPDKDYLVYVVSESADKIALIRFGPGGVRIDHQIDTGDMPVDIDGPHGIVISPDRQFYYVSHRAWPTVWNGLEVFDQRRFIGWKNDARSFSRHHGRLSRRQFSFCCELQSTWRHGAVISLRGIDANDD